MPRSDKPQPYEHRFDAERLRVVGDLRTALDAYCVARKSACSMSLFLVAPGASFSGRRTFRWQHSSELVLGPQNT